MVAVSVQGQAVLYLCLYWGRLCGICVCAGAGCLVAVSVLGQAVRLCGIFICTVSVLGKAV